MNRGDEDGADLPLEIIDLEPARPDDHGRDHSRDRTPASGARRRTAPLVVVVLLVAGLAASAIAGRAHHHANAQNAASTTRAGHAVINLRGGGLFSFRVGARVLTGGGSGLRVVDTDTGSFGGPTIAGLPAGEVTIVAHSGATVAARVGTEMYWFTLTEAIAHHVGADAAFAAVQPGELWLASAHIATEVPGDPGRLPRTRVATDGPAVGATRAGLLIDTNEGYSIQPMGSAVPARAFLPVTDTVIGVHADRVAWITDDCGALRCPVHVTEIANASSTSWIQLPGSPSPLALADATAFFSPDGGRVAVVVPDNNITKATTMVIADLHQLTTRIVPTTGYITAPARPGSVDAVGATVDWTGDGRYLVLAPALGTGDGRLSVIDPDDGRVVSSRIALDLGNTAAAIGSSTLGALDLPRHLDPHAPVAHPLAPSALPGLHLVGANANQIDVLDLGTEQLRSTPVGSFEPNPAGAHSIARVIGGWLVVRGGGVVDVIHDVGSTDARLVDAGSQVYSTNGGRDAWISIAALGGSWRVETYDGTTGVQGAPFAVSGRPVGALDQGVVVSRDEGDHTELDIVAPSGTVRTLTTVSSSRVRAVAAGGHEVAYSDDGGLHVIDATTGKETIVDTLETVSAAFSTNGDYLAWIDAFDHGVRALRIGGHSVGAPSLPVDRVLVADDGTLIATRGTLAFRGHVGVDPWSAISGLAPDPSAELALG